MRRKTFLLLTREIDGAAYSIRSSTAVSRPELFIHLSAVCRTFHQLLIPHPSLKVRNCNSKMNQKIRHTGGQRHDV
jgi:hypothetical protein